MLVADAGLGTINAVRLDRRALAAGRPVVALNRFDRTTHSTTRTARWLEERYGFETVTDPDRLAARWATIVAAAPPGLGKQPEG